MDGGAKKRRGGKEPKKKKFATRRTSYNARRGSRGKSARTGTGDVRGARHPQGGEKGWDFRQTSHRDPKESTGRGEVRGEGKGL